MKVGLIHHEGFSNTGEILVIPVKIIGDKNKISIKEFYVNDKDGGEIKESGIRFSLNIDN